MTPLSTPDESSNDLGEILRRAMRKAMFPGPLFDETTSLSVDPDIYQCRVETIRQAVTPPSGLITLPKGFAVDQPMVQPSVYDMVTGLVLCSHEVPIMAERMSDHVAWARFIPFPGAPSELTNRSQDG